MDKLTTYKERVSFARCLVEINMANDLPQTLMLKLPDGEVIEQAIFYENLPRFCKHCRIMGHFDAGCSVHKSNSKNKQLKADKITQGLSANHLN